MQRRTWLVSGLSIALVAAALAWAFAPRPIEVETAAAERGPFETVVEEDGKTRVKDRYVLSAPLTGVLDRVTLHEGDRVEVDGTVALLRPSLPSMLDERTLREQQARVETALAQLRRAEARIEAAKVAQLQADNEARRSERLAEQGFVSSSKRETDRLAQLAARKELDTAIEDRHVATHMVEQARAAMSAVRGADASARGFAVRSPVAGKVLRIAQLSETTVVLGTPLIEVGDTGRLEVVAELLTTDAVRAPSGAAVRIDRWGGTGSLAGRVARVEPGAFTKISALGVEEQRVRVVIDLVGDATQWQALGDGYRVGVRIVTQSQADVLKVPVSAVFPLPERASRVPGADASDGGRFAVYRVEDGRARLQPVDVAARNGSEAWLRDGLAPGQPVIVYPPAGLRDGDRIRPRSVQRQP